MVEKKQKNIAIDMNKLRTGRIVAFYAAARNLNWKKIAKRNASTQRFSNHSVHDVGI
jgi:hypothetical protein